MSEQRRDPTLSIRVAVATILGAAAAIVRFAERDWKVLPPHTLWNVVAGLLLLGCLDMALRAFFGSIRCDQCGGRIPRTHVSEGSRIRYHCSRCDIDWDTGWRVPRD
jgi:hypothetical protein